MKKTERPREGETLPPQLIQPPKTAEQRHVSIRDHLHYPAINLRSQDKTAPSYLLTIRVVTDEERISFFGIVPN
jgi:hypothetical protein